MISSQQPLLPSFEPPMIEISVSDTQQFQSGIDVVENIESIEQPPDISQKSTESIETNLLSLDCENKIMNIFRKALKEVMSITNIENKTQRKEVIFYIININK